MIKMKFSMMTIFIVIGMMLIICMVKTIVFEENKGNDMLFKDQTYHFEALRVINYATSAGADINEVLGTIGKIRCNNDDDWYREWKKTAERVENLAGDIIHDDRGKGYAYGRAHNYYRAAEFFLMPDDARKPYIADKLYETFYNSLDYLNVAYEIMEVPYEGKSLRAVYYPGPAGAEEKPLLIGVNGYDSIQEEMYFVFVQAALERGYSVLTYDGPGQGISIRKRGIHFTHEWEKPNSRIIDTFIERYYTPEQIVLLGDSLGGILVSRAAAFDKRISGIVNYDVFYDFAEAAMWEYPDGFKRRMFRDTGVGLLDRTVLRLLTKFNPEVKWAMAHGAWIMGVKEPWDVLRNYKNFSITEYAPDITCDVLLLAGEKDHFVPLELVEKNEAALINARSVKTIVFDEASGGHEHCQVGASYLWRAKFFDWLGSTF